MAVTPIPSDPRTWDDFRNPEARGFTKIDRDTPLEAITFGVGLLLTALGGFWAFALYSPRNAGNQGGMAAVLHDWRPVSIVSAGLVLLAVRLLTDNFYLIDSARHAIYYHFEVAWFRRVRLLLERRDIVGTSTQSRWRSSRSGSRRSWKYSWYEHRVVVIDTRGWVVPMTNWQQEALWDCNNEASDLAKKLDSAWFEMPEDSRLIVKRSGSGVRVTFGPSNWYMQPDLGSQVWLAALMLLVVAGALAILLK
jgi:hypothetical protein